MKNPMEKNILVYSLLLKDILFLLREVISIIDFCYCYLALFGYTYIFKNIDEKNLLKFSYNNNYVNFPEILVYILFQSKFKNIMKKVIIF